MSVSSDKEKESSGFWRVGKCTVPGTRFWGVTIIRIYCVEKKYLNFFKGNSWCPSKYVWSFQTHSRVWKAVCVTVTCSIFWCFLRKEITLAKNITRKCLTQVFSESSPDLNLPAVIIHPSFEYWFNKSIHILVIYFYWICLASYLFVTSSYLPKIYLVFGGTINIP